MHLALTKNQRKLISSGPAGVAEPRGFDLSRQAMVTARLLQSPGMKEEQPPSSTGEQARKFGTFAIT